MFARGTIKISILLCCLCLYGQHSIAAPGKQDESLSKRLLKQPHTIPGLLIKGAISPKQIPNPHWKANACIACHTKNRGANQSNLRSGGINKMCNDCHAKLSEHDYIHVSDIKVPKEMQKRMPADFRKSLNRGGKKMTCITCHDLPMTCKKSRAKERSHNPLFFRGGPYSSRTKLCYHCHDASKYQRVNAHDQISDKGVLQKDKCLICHTTDKDLQKAKNIDEVKFNLKNDLSRLCWGCHKWKPHPGGSFTFFSGTGGTPDHLVKPSARVMKRLEKKQKENDIIFPLEPGTGKVFCGTCHNPHEKGVIKLRQAAKGADEDKRLRMQNICGNCHDKE